VSKLNVVVNGELTVDPLPPVLVAVTACITTRPSEPAVVGDRPIGACPARVPWNPPSDTVPVPVDFADDVGRPGERAARDIGQVLTLVADLGIFVVIAVEMAGRTARSRYTYVSVTAQLLQHGGRVRLCCFTKRHSLLDVFIACSDQRFAFFLFGASASCL